MILNKKIIDRFESKIDKKDNNSCWEWTASRNKTNYGYFRIHPKTFLAHRISYLIYIGSPDGLMVCHKCDNPPCVNPNHLFLGTNKDNMIDMAKKKRCTFQKNPMPGTKHPSHKINDGIVKSIRNEFDNSYGCITRLSNKYNISRKLVYNLIKRKSWSHIP